MRSWLIGVAVFLGMIGCGGPATPPPNPGETQVLCSFLPVYLFAKGVVGEVPGIKVELMLPASQGCPHNYDLTPQDLARIASADVFIKNGAGLEEFSDEELHQASKKKLLIVDTSKPIDLITLDCDHDHDHAHDDHDHDHDHHHHGGVNPHFFSSPLQAAKQVRAIAAALADVVPEHAEAFHQNAERLANELETLGQQFQESSFEKRKIVTVHEIFDYLARDCGVEVVATIQSAPGHDPSPADLVDLVKQIEAQQVAAIFVEPQYSASIARVLEKEHGVAVFELDPVATADAADPPASYYLEVMRKNLETLRKALGGQGKAEEPKS